MASEEKSEKSELNVIPTGTIEYFSGYDIESLPFQINEEILRIWGEPQDLDQLRNLIDADGGIRDPLLCANIKGSDGKPFLYDGFTRLMIWTNNPTSEVPKIEVKEFENLGDVILKVLAVQKSRRNLTEVQIAYAGVEAMKLQCFDTSPRPQGRPKKKTKASEEKASEVALKELPSAKELAASFGVSDPIIRVILKAQEHPQILSDLISNDPEIRITPQQARNRMEGKERDNAIHQRAKTNQIRRNKIATMQAPTLPNEIKADGIFTGDATELLTRIKPNSINLVVSSPPYACGVPYDVTPPFDGDYPKYLDTFIRKPLTEIKRILVSGGRVALNFDNTYRSIQKAAAEDRSEVPNFFNMVKDVSIIAEDELGLLLMSSKIWYKQNCASIFAHGSNDCRTPFDNPNTEFLMTWAKDSISLGCAESESDITQKEYHDWAVTSWYISPQARAKDDSDDYHICPFPEEIPYRLIKLFCPIDGIVLDPFSGSGTTCFVARAMGRKYIGLENSLLYNESAARRLAKLDGLSLDEMRKQITRFIPASRVDGFQKHMTLKPKKLDKKQEQANSCTDLISSTGK